MDPRIVVCEEEARGCGFRQKGALYLRSEGLALPCDRMPLPVGTCPVCGAGIKPARGWTWIDPRPLVKDAPPCSRVEWCARCPLGGSVERAGLLWIGERYYRTPAAWTDEVRRMGVSRRITQVPKGLKVGETWVLVAHRKAVQGLDGELGPAIFHAFQPTWIEKVVDEGAGKEEIDALEKRGILPVVVRRIGEQQDLEGSDACPECGAALESYGGESWCPGCDPLTDAIADRIRDEH